MTRKKKSLKPGEQGHLSVSLPTDMIIALDAEAERRTDDLGFKVRRSDVVTLALREWLDARGKRGK